MPTASPLISRAQVGGGRVRAAGKALLNRDDEPVIGFAADVGASGHGTLDGCNQMRVARVGHRETSRGIYDCESKFTVMQSANDERPWRMACTRKTSNDVITVRGARGDVLGR